jgi:hypothetical protein
VQNTAGAAIVPSVSDKQHRFMEAVSHSPEFAAKAGVPQKVGEDFARADDKAGITKKPSGSPKSRDEHMARLAKHQTHGKVAKAFGKSRSTVSRGVMRQGFNRIGDA